MITQRANRGTGGHGKAYGGTDAFCLVLGLGCYNYGGIGPDSDRNDIGLRAAVPCNYRIGYGAGEIIWCRSARLNDCPDLDRCAGRNKSGL